MKCCEYDSWGLYYKTLQIYNLRKIDIYCSKPVSFVLSVTFTGLDKHTSILLNQ